MTFRLTTRPGHPTFVDLPWEQPLDEWTDGRLVTPVRGISRHVVRFVAYGDAMYALKELLPPVAEREHRLLHALADRHVPVVDAIGLATGREAADGEDLDAVLITRHLDFSLPYRALFSRLSRDELWVPLLDALAQLLVRIHLAGFFWGDCSLSNTLFRRDAGALAATLVDAETGELHDTISDGQRRHDIALAEVNVAGELLDLAAAGGWEDEFDPAEVADDLVRRYEQLWVELTRTEVISSDDRRLIDQRVRRLNDLGFDVTEVMIEPVGDGYRLKLSTAVVEPGHHQRRLLALTGLDVQENQARRLLNDIVAFKGCAEGVDGVPLGQSIAALRWLNEVFEPTIAAVPQELRGKLEPAELFHQVLEHRWFLSEAAHGEVSTEAAVESYVEEVLRRLPDEQRLLLDVGLPSTE